MKTYRLSLAPFSYNFSARLVKKKVRRYTSTPSRSFASSRCNNLTHTRGYAPRVPVYSVCPISPVPYSQTVLTSTRNWKLVTQLLFETRKLLKSHQSSSQARLANHLAAAGFVVVSHFLAFFGGIFWGVGGHGPEGRFGSFTRQHAHAGKKKPRQHAPSADSGGQIDVDVRRQKQRQPRNPPVPSSRAPRESRRGRQPGKTLTPVPEPP